MSQFCPYCQRLITSEVGNGRPELTARQRVVLDMIRKSLQDNGYAPTMREICDAVGTSSTNSAFKCIGILERKGYIKRKINGVHTRGFVLL